MSVMARSSAHGRVPDGPVPRHQGSLDALCGLYAIVNAVCHLVPELPEGADARLFARLVRRLAKVKAKPLKGVWRGLKVRPMRRLVRHACRWIARSFGIVLELKRMRRALRERPRLGQVWQELRGELRAGAVAIVGIGGLEAHWSVAVHVSRTWLKLIDSDGLTALKRSGCAVRPSATRHVLDPAEMLLIGRSPSR